MPVFRKFRSARVSDRRNLYSIQKTMVGFDMGGSGERYIRITAEIYEEEIFVFYVDDPEAFVEALRDYMINAGAGKIWGQ